MPLVVLLFLARLVYNAVSRSPGTGDEGFMSDQIEPSGDEDLRLDDLRSIRRALGKTQAEMARLLSASTRAIQSYEQGWRPVPPHVRKMALFLLCVSRRHKGRVVPCWQIRQCSAEDRARCPAYQLGEGELCWLVTGDACPIRESASAEEKADLCAQCPVLIERLRQQ
jgi:DNA-binding XRE family transcriptional regulator